MSSTLADRAKDPAEPEVPPRLAWLARAFGLSRSDLEAVVDLATRREGGAAVTTSGKFAAGGGRRAFDSDSPLVRAGLVHVAADLFELDDRVASFLAGDDRLPPALAACARVLAPRSHVGGAFPEIQRRLSLLAHDAARTTRALRVHLAGPAGSGAEQIAHAVASSLSVSLVVLDVAAVPATVQMSALMRDVLLDAWLRDAVLMIDGVGALLDADRTLDVAELLRAIAADRGITFLAGPEALSRVHSLPADTLMVALGIPAARERRDVWAAALCACDLVLDSGDVDTVAGRFRLTSAQVERAAESARMRYAWAQTNGDAVSTFDAVTRAARAQCGHELAALATLTPPSRWEDLVVPDATATQLSELLNRVVQRERVMTEWGFAAKLSYGTSPTALFYGPSGTGKTMAAAALAQALALDLYRVELAGVVSKYIGETEKNLDRIFDAAEHSNAILLFDEADALFGKRSEVKDAHDRYANVEISYLLQRMERHDGISILATNLRGHLDDAFTRRLAFVIHFPLPDEAHRRRIWRGVWPAAAPLAADIDLEYIARAFPLSGGNIKNVALAAAFLAASETSSIGMPHVLDAVRREYQKMGKELDPTEMRSAWRERAVSAVPRRRAAAGGD